MSSFTEFIVGLWFLPVTLFIILPLAILAGWVGCKAGAGLLASRRSPAKPREQAPPAWEAEKAQL